MAKQKQRKIKAGGEGGKKDRERGRQEPKGVEVAKKVMIVSRVDA